MQNRRCIFHIPYRVDINWPSGTNIRPIKMIEAFKKIGYEVDVVMGYGKEREEAIEKIKYNIQQGIVYEFVYSESCTEPTLLTEENHLPKYPFLDFNFFSFCKKNNIKIGLFYRDIYWQFDIYKKSLGFLKRNVARFFYKYDLRKYNKLVDVLYLPSILMYNYLPIKFKGEIKELPPAVNYVSEHNEVKVKSGYIKLFYVGGITGLYNLENLFKVINKLDGIKLTVCCRESEWNSCKNIYEKYINDKIEIVHKSGKELEKYYKEADILSLYFESSEYRKFAMPIKLFEYLGNKKPIISTEGTATGEFIKKYDIGWTIDYDEDELVKLLQHLKERSEEINLKRSNIDGILEKNTWECRAAQVAKELS